MLYIGKTGAVTYPALGNMEMNSGDAGTLALWYHPCSADQRCTVFSITTEDGHFLHLARSQSEWLWKVSADDAMFITTVSTDVAWRHVVVTWDFSGGPGNGVMRLYLDGEEVPESPLTGT